MVDPEKIKVAQIVRAPIGGIRKHVLSIIEGSSEKFDVFLITNEEAGDIKYETYKEKNDCRKIYNINIIDSPCFEDLVNIIKICKIISKEKIDVLHGHGAKGGLYARVVGLILRRKVIYTAHGGSIHTMHGRVKNLIYAYIEKILYYMTNYLVFESNFSMNEYSRRIHKRNYKFILNRNAIELPKDFENLKLNDIDPSENIVVGSFGLLRKIKGHDLLIESCSLLISEGLDISLKIYGSGEERKNLEELAKKFNFSERLEIHEYTNKIYEEMRSCHIVAQPSRFESFGYVPNSIYFSLDICFHLLSISSANITEIIEKKITDNRAIELFDNFESLFFMYSFRKYTPGIKIKI
jgi:glycosyltransferase involved in cell wall biosynthesis